ncbi:MAG: hypothetical protein R3E79_00950 [Caldilineaceae bacterium]
MDLTHHTEYQSVYLHHQTLAQGCQTAVAAWQASGESLPVAEWELQWTPATAHTFVGAMRQLFQAYNHVLWQEFHYCRQCGGQCCVVDASDVRPFDLIALALLALAPPVLPPRIAANPQDCIYLAGSQCTWPTDWRTIKCWSFYCLGSGPWPVTAALGELHDAVTKRLQAVVTTHLPEPLRLYERTQGMHFADHLADPVAFAHTLHAACHTLLVAPLHTRFPTFPLDLPLLVQPKATHTPIFLMPDPDFSEFITAATEELYASPPDVPAGVTSSTDQLLSDLDTLTWIIENQPAQRPQLLAELYTRYAGAPVPRKGEKPSLWYGMRNQILTLLNEIP